jgi:hypothetical protein
MFCRSLPARGILGDLVLMMAKTVHLSPLAIYQARIRTIKEPDRKRETMAQLITNRSARGRDNGATLGFEAKLWQAVDALRNNMDAAEYKHVVLGLIFVKHLSDAFEAKHAELDAQRSEGADPEDHGWKSALGMDPRVKPAGGM